MSTKWFKDVTPDELRRWVAVEIRNDLKNTLKEVALKVESMILDMLDTWYSSREPTTYTNRTLEFLTSLTIGKVVKVGDYYQIEIYFDANKLNEDRNINSPWVTHKDDDGQRINFLDMMENGWHLPSGSGIDFKGHHIQQKLIDWGEVGKFGNEVYKILKSKGYKIDKKIDS